MEQIFFDYKIKPNYEIDNFHVGKANEDAYNLLLNNNTNKLNINKILLIGPPKSGKTHLSKIWENINDAISYDNNLKIILNSKKHVLIDNIFINIDEEEVFHIINHCHSNQLNILITSNTPLKAFKFLIKDLSSRLKTFYRIDITLPDDELLINLMIKLFHDKQIIVKNPKVFNYIISRVHRSYEKVFILIDKIDTLLLKTNRQLTIPLIKELI
tara:strand:- start:372 stop:1013 length:642 start_codon:yes stop_codon:yes gene_type:complete